MKMEEATGRQASINWEKESICRYQMDSKNTCKEITTELEQWGTDNLLKRESDFGKI